MALRFTSDASFQEDFCPQTLIGPILYCLYSSLNFILFIAEFGPPRMVKCPRIEPKAQLILLLTILPNYLTPTIAPQNLTFRLLGRKWWFWCSQPILLMTLFRSPNPQYIFLPAQGKLLTFRRPERASNNFGNSIGRLSPTFNGKMWIKQ